MAKDSAYRITEIVGTSKKSREDAASNAVSAAAGRQCTGVEQAFIQTTGGTKRKRIHQ